MLKHLYVEVDATEAQKQQFAPIVKAAARDLLPLRDKMRDARGQAVTYCRNPPSTEPRSRPCGRASSSSPSKRPAG